MLFKPRRPETAWEKVQKFFWPRTGLVRAWTYIWRRMTRLAGSPHTIALGFAAGAFAACTPFVGFHFIVGAIVALLIGGNLLASAVGTSVANPLTFPFIWLGTFNLGGWLLGYEQRGEVKIDLPDGMFWMLFTDPATVWRTFWEATGPILVPMLVGSLPIGFVIGLVTYFLVKPAINSYQIRRKARLAEGIDRRSEVL